MLSSLACTPVSCHLHLLLTYDAVNQLISESLPDSQITQYTYDLVGNLTNVSDRDSVLTMTRDLANRLVTSLSLSNWAQTTYSDDRAGQLVSVLHQP